MIKRKMVNRGGRSLTITSQYDNTGRLLRVLMKSTPIPEVSKKKKEWEVTSPFLKIWEK